MWSWHWSPLTQTSLLLSPSDGLASFHQTTLAIGVKVVKKVITSKFRFHLIAIYALGCFRNFSCTPVPKLPWRAPNPRETSERMNFNVIDKKQLIWKLLIYCIDIWCLFFMKKMSQNVWATIMPFGPVTLIFCWAKIFFSGQRTLALISGTVYILWRVNYLKVSLYLGVIWYFNSLQWDWPPIF